MATLAGSFVGYAVGTALAGPAGALGVYPGMAVAWGVERAVRSITAKVRARRALQPARTPDTPQVSKRKAARLRGRNRSHGRHRANEPRRGRGKWSAKNQRKQNTPELKPSWPRLYVGENIRWGSLQGIGGAAVSQSAHNWGLMKGYMAIVPIVSVITATQAYLGQKKVTDKEHHQNERHSAAADRDYIHESRLDGHDRRMDAMGSVLQKISQGQAVSQAEMAAALGQPGPQGSQPQAGQQPQPAQPAQAGATPPAQQRVPVAQPGQYPQPQPGPYPPPQQPGQPGAQVPPPPTPRYGPPPPQTRYSREQLGGAQPPPRPGQPAQPRQSGGPPQPPPRPGQPQRGAQPGPQPRTGPPNQPGHSPRHARDPHAPGGPGGEQRPGHGAR